MEKDEKFEKDTGKGKEGEPRVNICNCDKSTIEKGKHL